MANVTISQIAAFTPPIAGGDLLEIERAGVSYKVTAADLVAGSQPLDADLTALAALASTGLTVRTGAGTVAARTLTAPAAGITVSNGDGVAGNPTLALADDLAALEALSGTNTIYYRSGASAWSAVTIGSNLAFAGGTLSASAPTPSLSINAQSGTSYTVVAGDAGKLVRLSSATLAAVSLPQATGSFGAGFFCYITCAAVNGTVITPTTSTINGKASYQLRQGGTVLVVSDGTNYQVVPLTAFYGGASGAGYSITNPDGTVTGGDARGSNAVDLQTNRTNSANVASGANSFVVGVDNGALSSKCIAMGDANTAVGTNAMAIGSGNSASSTSAVALGASNTASAANAISIGCSNVANGIQSTALGYYGHTNGNVHQLSVGGDGIGFVGGTAQMRVNIFWASTAGAIATRLTADGQVATTNNVGALFAGSAIAYTAELVIFDKTNQKSNSYSFALSSIARPTNEASTVMGTGNPSVVAGPTTGGGLTLQAEPTITADTFRGGFNISFTPPAGNTATIQAICRITGTETH